MQDLGIELLSIDALRLQLSRKRELSTIIGRHSNLYAKPTESDLLTLEIAQLTKRIAEIEGETPR